MAVRWPAKRGDIPALFRGDQTISGDWTFTGTVDLSGATLTLDKNYAVVDENEDITGAWKFSGADTNPGALKSSLSANMLHIDGKEAIDGNDTYLRLNQNGDFASGIHTPGGFLIFGLLNVGDGSPTDGTVLQRFNIPRAWEFRSYATGASNRLGLFSTSNKSFDIGGDTNGLLARFQTNTNTLEMTGAIRKSSGGAYPYFDSSTYSGGGKITVSSTAPVSPATGDIWFDTS